MAVSPIGGSVGSIVPPGVKPDAAEVSRLRAQLDLVHAQLMSSPRSSPQRMADLVNSYLETVRRLHGNVAPARVDIVHKAGGGHGGSGPIDVCVTPAPPAPPVPIPYPTFSASSAPATKTSPGNDQAQRSKLDATHHQIKSSTSAPRAHLRSVVASHVTGLCNLIYSSSKVKVEGASVARLGDPLRFNR